MQDVEHWKAEAERWARRVKVLEARLECISQLSQGRHDEAAQFLAEPRSIQSPAMLFGHELHAEVEKSLRTPRRRRVVQFDSQAGLKPKTLADSIFGPPPATFPTCTRPFGSPLQPPPDAEYHSATPDPLGVEPRTHEIHVEAVEFFSLAMVAKLDVNAHKAHWADIMPEHLLVRLKEELQELEDVINTTPVALESAERDYDQKICEEAVDVANMAMMIFDIHSAPRPV